MESLNNISACVVPAKATNEVYAATPADVEALADAIKILQVEVPEEINKKRRYAVSYTPEETEALVDALKTAPVLDEFDELSTTDEDVPQEITRIERKRRPAVIFTAEEAEAMAAAVTTALVLDKLELSPADEEKYAMGNDVLHKSYGARKDFTTVTGNAAKYQDVQVACTLLESVGQVLRAKEMDKSSLFQFADELCVPVRGPPGFDQILAYHPGLFTRHDSFLTQMQELSEGFQKILGKSAAVVPPGQHHVTLQGLCNAGLLNKQFSDTVCEHWPPTRWPSSLVANVTRFDKAIQDTLLPQQREVLRHTYGDQPLCIDLRFTRMCLTSDGSIILLAIEENQQDGQTGLLRRALRQGQLSCQDQDDVLKPLGGGPPGGIIHMSLGRLLPSAEKGSLATTPEQLLELCEVIDAYNCKDDATKALMHVRWDDVVHLRVNNGILSDWEDGARCALYSPRLC